MPRTKPVSKTPRRQPVSVPEIARTALALLDEMGLEGLTMRRLAAAIGVEPMTLYRYLPNKEAILAVVADLLWQDLRPFVPEVDGWQNQVRTMWLDMFDLMLRHPHAVPLIARAGTYSQTATEGTAHLLDLLRRAGFKPEAATEFLHTTGALVVGFAFAHLWQHQADQGQRPAAPAGQPAPLPPEVTAYAGAIGPWTRGQFESALTLLITAYASRLQTPQDARPAQRPS